MSGRNPWQNIALSDYEGHMSLDAVAQLPALERLMAEQFVAYPASSLMILGVAGGNGLGHIRPDQFRQVYGVDVNCDYLAACQERYPHLAGIFIPTPVDLCRPEPELPQCQLVVANLLVEYIGYAALQRVLRRVRPVYFSCAIQVNQGDGFVSRSPYAQVFDPLSAVYYSIDEPGLSRTLAELGYVPVLDDTLPLPNGKALRRLDYLHD